MYHCLIIFTDCSYYTKILLICITITQTTTKYVFIKYQKIRWNKFGNTFVNWPNISMKKVSEGVSHSKAISYLGLGQKHMKKLGQDWKYAKPAGFFILQKMCENSPSSQERKSGPGGRGGGMMAKYTPMLANQEILKSGKGQGFCYFSNSVSANILACLFEISFSFALQQSVWSSSIFFPNLNYVSFIVSASFLHFLNSSGQSSIRPFSRVSFWEADAKLFFPLYQPHF